MTPRRVLVVPARWGKSRRLRQALEEFAEANGAEVIVKGEVQRPTKRQRDFHAGPERALLAGHAQGKSDAFLRAGNQSGKTYLQLLELMATMRRAAKSRELRGTRAARREEWARVWKRYRKTPGHRGLRRRLMRRRLFHGGDFGGPIA